MYGTSIENIVRDNQMSEWTGKTYYSELECGILLHVHCWKYSAASVTTSVDLLKSCRFIAVCPFEHEQEL